MRTPAPLPELSPRHGAPTEDHVESMLVDRVEEGLGLKTVPGSPGPGFFDHPALVDGLLDRSDDEIGLELGHDPVPELEHLVEVVPGIDVHYREGKTGGPESLYSESQGESGVLASGEEENRVLRFGYGFANDVNRLRFEGAKMARW